MLKLKIIEIFNESQQIKTKHNNLITKLTLITSKNTSSSSFSSNSNSSSNSSSSNLKKNNNLKKKDLEDENNSNLNEVNEVNEIIQKCYDKILSYSKKESSVDLVIDFYSGYVKNLIQNENNFEININYLLKRSESLDKVVRFRSCQTISTIFNLITEDIEIDINLWDNISTRLLPRLCDKCPTVRIWAVNALKDFQKPQESNDLIITEYLRLLESDPSKDVRLAVIECLCLCPNTLNSLLNRLRDVKSEVRMKVIEQLIKSVEAGHLTSKQIVLFVRHSLCDRDETISKYSFQLVIKWLNKLQYNIPKFLRLIGLNSYSNEAEYVSWRILQELQSSSSSSSALETLYSNYLISWNSLHFIELNSSEVLWILSRSEYLQQNKNKLQSNEYIEKYLPDTIILCRLISEGIVALKVSYDYLENENNDTNNTNELSYRTHVITYELLLKYLIRLLHFVDLNDIVGCKEVIELCNGIFEDILNGMETFIPSLTEIYLKMLKVTIEPKNMMKNMMELIDKLWPINTTGLSLDIEENSDNSNLIEKEKEKKEDDADEKEEENSELKEEKIFLSQYRCLQIMIEMIRDQIRIMNQSSLSSSSTTTTTTSSNSVLWSFSSELIISHILESLQMPYFELRLNSIKAVGLLCLLSKDLSEKYYNIIYQVVNTTQEDVLIRCEAVETLGDILLIYGHESHLQNNLKDILYSFKRILNHNHDSMLTNKCIAVCSKLLLSSSSISISMSISSSPSLSPSSIILADILSQLIITFFNSHNEEVENDNENELESIILTDNEKSKINNEYLDQILSVFIQSYCTMGDMCRYNLLLESISYVIIEYSQRIRNEDVKMKLSLDKVITHILSWCESMSVLFLDNNMNMNENTYKSKKLIETKYKLSAIMMKELLTLTTSNELHRKSMNELVKVFQFLTPCDKWLRDNNTILIMKKIILLIKKYCLFDRVNKKYFLDFISSFEQVKKQVDNEMNNFNFYDFAPGLRELIGDDDEDNDNDNIIDNEDDILDENQFQQKDDDEEDQDYENEDSKKGVVKEKKTKRNTKSTTKSKRSTTTTSSSSTTTKAKKKTLIETALDEDI